MTTRATRSQRRRTVVALAVVLAVLSGFVVRLVDIQVVNAAEHLDDSNQWAFGSSRPLYGTRGPIVDASGQTLAGSILQYDAVLTPVNVGAVVRTVDGDRVEIPWDRVAKEIGAITGQSGAEVEQIVVDALAENDQSQWAVLAKGLSTEQYRELADLGAGFLSFEQHPARTYPDGAVAGNIVGFMGSDGVALAGLERAQAECLQATDGSVKYQRGKDGVIIPGTETRVPAVDGGTLQLTINRDLQWYMQQLIAEQTQNFQALSGTITVVEVATGKIRAAAEYPTVDPNNVLATDENDRGSRVFSGTFEPGSTFKAITAATVIDAGGLTPMSTETAQSREHFANGATIQDAVWHEEQRFTLNGALVDSSNVAISKFADTVSAQTRHDYLAAFGVGQPTAVGFPGEESGVLHPVEDWDYQSHYTTAFGQYLTATAPQVASVYQTIANDGVKMPLSLVESCTTPDGTVITPDLPEPVQVVSSETAKQTALMLENVLAQGGLASQVEIPGYRIAGKTGTGEKPDGNGGYKVGVYATSLVGFAPADDPQFVVMVTLDEPTTVRSSAANASAFQNAMTQVLKTYRVLPSDSETTLLPKYQ